MTGFIENLFVILVIMHICAVTKIQIHTTDFTETWIAGLMV